MFWERDLCPRTAIRTPDRPVGTYTIAVPAVKKYRTLKLLRANKNRKRTFKIFWGRQRHMSCKKWQEMPLSVQECLPLDTAPRGRHLPKGVESNPEICYHNSGYTRSAPLVTCAKPLKFQIVSNSSPTDIPIFRPSLDERPSCNDPLYITIKYKVAMWHSNLKDQIIKLSRKHTQAREPFNSDE